jgi:hypothetical protein
MKVRYTLYHMDEFLKEMLKADVNKYKFELIWEAKKVLKRLEKDGYLSKAITTQTIRAHKDMMEFKAKEIINDIDNILKFEVKSAEDMNNGTVILEIWVNSDYFINADVVRQSIPKFMMKRINIITRQKMIDGFEKSIAQDYTRTFSGEILEDDGEGLTVKKL